MTALLLMASMAQVGGSPLSSETFISTSFPREFAAVQRIQPGVLPDGHRIHRRYRILEYEMVERGGVREVTYTVRNTIQSEQNDVFRIKVTFLSDNGTPPERMLPTKGLPAYVQDGQGALNELAATKIMGGWA